jgi:purine nucleoside permease
LVRCDWLKTKTHKLHRDPKNTAAKISTEKCATFRASSSGIRRGRVVVSRTMIALTAANFSHAYKNRGARC